MSLDCIIIAQVSRNKGKIATRPVSGFLRDSIRYYSAVFQHLKNCSMCNPKEALEGFFANRAGRSMTSTIIDMAVKYKREFPDQIPDQLVSDFIVRGEHDWDRFITYVDFLTSEDFTSMYQSTTNEWYRKVKDALPILKKGISPLEQAGLFNKIGFSPLSNLHQELVINYPDYSVSELGDLLRGRGKGEGPNLRQSISIILNGDRSILSENTDPEITEYLKLREVWSIMSS